jgi:hypothetical protein
MKSFLICIVVISVMAGLRAAPTRAQTPAQTPAQMPAPTTAPTKQEIDAAVAVFSKPLDVSSNDDAMRQKLKERHNTAVRLLQARIEGYHKGTSDAASVFEAARIVGDAKRDLATSTAERNTLAHQMLDLLRMVEQRMSQEFRSGLISETSLLTAQLARQAEEIEIMNLEHADSKAPTTRPQ